MLGLAAGCAAIALLTAHPAVAAQASQALLLPSDLSQAGKWLRRPIVAISPDGEAVVAWMWQRSNNQPLGSPECCSTFTVEATSGIWVGIEWQKPTTVSAPVKAFIPRSIAMDARDDAAVVWPGGGRTYAAFRSGGNGTWQPPVAISGEGGDFASIAFGGEGDLTAAWEQTGGGPYAAVRPWSSGTWQEPVDLAPANHETAYPALAVDAQGDAIVVWSSGGGIQVAVRRGEEGNWQPPVTISQPNQKSDGDPEVALNDRGEVVVVWSHGLKEGTTEGLSTVQAAAGSIESGVWQAPVELQPAALPQPPPAVARMPRSRILGKAGPGGMSLPQVALDAHGDAVAMWTDTGPNSSAVQTSVRPAGGDWQQPVNLSLPGEQPEEAKLGGDARGDAAAVWDAQGVIAATVRQPPGSWQDPVDISAEDEQAGNDPQLAINERGEAIAVWEGPETFAFNAGEPLRSEPPARPTIYQASLTSTRFRVARLVVEGRRLAGKRQRQATGQLPEGSAIDLGLSAAATVTLTVERAEPGLREGSACVVSALRLEGNKGNARKPNRIRGKHTQRSQVTRCTRMVPVSGGTTSVPERSGARTLELSGRVGENQRALTAGRYRASLVASNVSGSSEPVRLPFSIAP